MKIPGFEGQKKNICYDDFGLEKHTGAMKILYAIEYKGIRAILTSIMGLEVTKTAISAHILKTIMAMKTDMPMKCLSDYYCLEDYECILLNGRGCVKKIKHNEN